MTLRHAAAAALAAVVVAGSVVSPAQALEVDPDAPVVVDDAITLWPGASDIIDVLANDSDPNGDDLTPCWLPMSGIFEEDGPVAVGDAAAFYGYDPGNLIVQASRTGKGTHVVDYSVCNHTRVTPAKLTVTIRLTMPVDVVRDKAPGRILVTNHNTRPVKLVVYEHTGCRRDVIRWIEPGVPTSVKVHYRRIAWIAGIVDGVADLGRLSGIKLAGKEGEPGPTEYTCSLSTTPYWDEMLPW